MLFLLYRALSWVPGELADLARDVERMIKDRLYPRPDDLDRHRGIRTYHGDYQYGAEGDTRRL